jgi:hypothetical protein
MGILFLIVAVYMIIYLLAVGVSGLAIHTYPIWHGAAERMPTPSKLRQRRIDRRMWRERRRSLVIDGAIQAIRTAPDWEAARRAVAEAHQLLKEV